MNAFEQNKLAEIISLCLSSVASTLSSLLDQPFKHNLRSITELEISQLENALPMVDYDTEVSAVYLKSEGDVRLGILFLIPLRNIKKLSACLLGKDEERPTSLEESSIAEAASMLAGSFLTCLAKATGFRLQVSVPGLNVDVFEALVEAPIADIMKTSNKVIVADDELRMVDDATMRIRVLIFLEHVGVTKIVAGARTAS